MLEELANAEEEQDSEQGTNKQSWVESSKELGKFTKNHTVQLDWLRSE